MLGMGWGWGCWVIGGTVAAVSVVRGAAAMGPTNKQRPEQAARGLPSSDSRAVRGAAGCVCVGGGGWVRLYVAAPKHPKGKDHHGIPPPRPVLANDEPSNSFCLAVTSRLKFILLFSFQTSCANNIPELP